MSEVQPKVEKILAKLRLTSAPLVALVYQEFDLSHDLVRKLLNTIHSQSLSQLQVRRGKDWTVGKEAINIILLPISYYFVFRIKTWIKKLSIPASTNQIPRHLFNTIRLSNSSICKGLAIFSCGLKRRRSKRPFREEKAMKKSIHCVTDINWIFVH